MFISIILVFSIVEVVVKFSQKFVNAAKQELVHTRMMEVALDLGDVKVVRFLLECQATLDPMVVEEKIRSFETQALLELCTRAMSARQLLNQLPEEARAHVPSAPSSPPSQGENEAEGDDLDKELGADGRKPLIKPKHGGSLPPVTNDDIT